MRTLTHLVSAILTASSFVLLSSAAWADDYQAFYLYLGDDPAGDTAWTYDAKGLAHDSDYWYIAQDDVIWRWPLTHELGGSPTSPGVARRPLSEYAELNLTGLEEFGDPCVYRYGGVDYLLMPFGRHSSGPDQIHLVVFECPSLAYIDQIALPAGMAQWWFGVDASGDVYSTESADPATLLYRYSVDWSRLQQSGILSIGNPMAIVLYQEDGVTPVSLGAASTGGEFTSDGGLLYLISERIHVFDTSNWRRIGQSINGSGHFNYEVSANPIYTEYTGGLTISGAASPLYPAQMQAVVTRWNGFTGAQTTFLKHYTHIIRVDSSNSGSQDGTFAHPFRTVTGAVNLAWSGAEIRTHADTYNEVVIINKRVRLTTDGGPTRIGG